jgi:undecaprenyl diphosphate synthase
VTAAKEPFVSSEDETRTGERPSTSLGANGSGVPRHVAIIMDGKGRWALQKRLPRVAGHKAGAEAVRRTLQAAADQGVEVLTLYAFSSENWRRSAEEIADLTALMRFYLERELDRLMAEGVRLKLIGDYTAFGSELVQRLERAVERTAGNSRLTLVVALNYGSRAEIANAARTLAARAAAGDIAPDSIDEQSIAGELQTSDLPELDLLIRTSGEVRLSNFLLWQAAYAELLFLDVLWPDFDEAAFADALDRFAGRQRRFGGRGATA